MWSCEWFQPCAAIFYFIVMPEKFFNISLTPDELISLIDSLSFELSVDPLRCDSVRMTKMRLRDRFRSLITNYRKSVFNDCISFDLFE